MNVVSTEVDLADRAKSSAKSIIGCSLPEALLHLVVCDHPPEPDELMKETIKDAQTFPIQHLFPADILDHQHRVAYRAPGISGDNAENERLRNIMAIETMIAMWSFREASCNLSAEKTWRRRLSWCRI
jgi:hypothetical protein